MSIEIVHSLSDIPDEVTAVVALGKQYGIDSNHDHILASPDHLSEDSRITVRGVGYTCLAAMERGRELRVLFSGNKKALFTSAALDFMAIEFPDVPHYWYDEPDDGSITTNDSAVRVPAILRAEGHTSSVLETVGYHAKRSRKQFARTSNGLIACVAATDSIVAEHSDREKQYIKNWDRSSRVKKEKIKEKVAIGAETGILGSITRNIVKARRP